MAYKHSSSASIIVDAPIDKVFALLNDLNRLADWTPFVKMDKTIQHSVNEVGSGVGAVYSWKGKRMGVGTMTITSVSEPSEIHARMTFGAKNSAETAYLLLAVGNTTDVTWTMHGERGLGDQIVAKVLGLDKLMSKNFADGLADLKALLENK
jgi:uncharacterized protein YndB with AHSA1/START domain